MGRKSRKSHEKPRSKTLLLDMGKPVVLNQIVLGKDSIIKTINVAGQEQQPVESRLITTYDRPERPDKGPKLVHQIILPPENMTLDPNIALTRYTNVLAVDTNKPEADFQHVFFTGFIQSKIVPHIDGGLELRICRETVLELHNLSVSPEHFGWAFICQSSNNPPKGSRIALIVDSDLGNIPLINKREKPIIGNYYLPDHFILLYATDKGKYIANELIKKCDRNAREVARQVSLTSESSLPPLLRAQPEDPFTHIRVWEHPQNFAVE